MGFSKRHKDLLLATAEQSRETDRRTIEELGIPGETLMEIAGFGAAEYISSEFSQDTNLLFVCGKGNNAGDAFVCARAQLSDGYDITLFPVLGTNNLTDDARLNLDRLLRIAKEMNTEIAIWERWQDPSPFGLIIDGIFGTGLGSNVKSPVSSIIEEINRSGKPVCALDIPSGLHCDTGNVLGTSIRAGITLQFGLRKLGCYLGDGPDYCGKRELIGLPFPGVYKQDIKVRLLNESLYPVDLLTSPHQQSSRSVSSQRSSKELRNNRKQHTTETAAGQAKVSLHKYNNGVVHVIGGSDGLTGAPLYSARAAWSLGMGAVTLIHPAGWSASLAVQAPELIKKPVGSGDSFYFTQQHAKEILPYLQEKPGVIVIGPGAGRNEKTADFVRQIIRESDGPLIIDADALRCIAGHEEAVTRRNHPEQVILTPHPGELSYLMKSKPDDDAGRMKISAELSQRLGCTVLAKGNPVFVHSPDQSDTIVTGYDTSAFARAGFGDILAGHIAAFLSRTENPLLACEAGLLYGFRKLTDTLSGGTRFPEPTDLI